MHYSEAAARAQADADDDDAAAAAAAAAEAEAAHAAVQRAAADVEGAFGGEAPLGDEGAVVAGGDERRRQ